VDERRIRQERSQNLWTSGVRKAPALERATSMEVDPRVGTERIGGLHQAQEEVLTHACGLTNPEVYARWGTHPASGLLLIGERGVGKRLLARALATRADTAFLCVQVPRLVLETLHRGAKAGELLDAWSQLLGELPPVTVFFEELEFSQAQEIGAHRPDLPVGPIMDFLLDVVDGTVGRSNVLMVGSTTHPDALRPAFFAPGRFERVVEVSPAFPGDVVAALHIHARDAEKAAGRKLFDVVDWEGVVRQYRQPSPGDWVRLLHGALRRKASCDAGGEEVPLVSTRDLGEEVERFLRASRRLGVPGPGTYV
jgi:ATP-dependent 26S proteasome regulatory subunit